VVSHAHQDQLSIITRKDAAVILEISCSIQISTSFARPSQILNITVDDDLMHLLKKAQNS